MVSRTSRTVACESLGRSLHLQVDTTKTLTTISYEGQAVMLLAKCLAIALIVVSALSDVLQAEDRNDQYVIFKSADRGRSWSRSDDGLPGNARINAFASMGELTIVGTDSDIYFSADEGKNWSASACTPKNVARVLSFASLGQKVFAGTDGSGMLFSWDRGRTWSVVNGFHPKKVRTILCLNESIYAGTDEEGVFASRDRGETWIPLTRGLPSGSQVFALGTMKGKLFAGLYSKGLHMWNDQEQCWTNKGNVSPLALSSLGDTLIAGHNPGGILWSDDSGASWTRGAAARSTNPGINGSEKGDELSSDAPVWELAAGDELLVAGAASGIFYSDDRGRTWTRARVGLPAASPGISFLVTKTMILAGSIIDR
jgi:photosystem II stability/assembly factor-like uncharacterized protein